MDRNDWSWLVSWSWLVRCFVYWGRWISSLSFIGNVSNIARMSIVDMIVDNLGATIGKGNTICARCLVTITSLICTKVSLAVVICNSIFIPVYRWGIVSGPFSMNWGVVWSWGRGVVWSWSRGVVWSWSRGMVWCWSRYVVWNNNGVGYYWCMNCMNWSCVSNNWSMNNGRSMVGLMNSMGNYWSMAMLNCSMALNISCGNSQDGRECDKGLKKNIKWFIRYQNIDST